METATSDEKMSKEEPEQQSEDQAEEPIKGLPDSVLRFIEMQEARMEAPMPKVEIDSLSTRSYLDHTVVPVMMDAMAAVARQRPPDPIEYVAMFILKNKDKYKQY
ncbi:protein dpy-30 homolog [Halichondria panicea]|uniref:protein dpy-30 homolog n=1 Tax=Halichondria panicea TaxID=6063 RepID=UPI00312B84A4